MNTRCQENRTASPDKQCESVDRAQARSLEADGSRPVGVRSVEHVCSECGGEGVIHVQQNGDDAEFPCKACGPVTGGEGMTSHTKSEGCREWKSAQQSGTDNEAYGALLSCFGHTWNIGCGLEPIVYCPWCGTPLTDEERG